MADHQLKHVKVEAPLNSQPDRSSELVLRTYSRKHR